MVQTSKSEPFAFSRARKKQIGSQTSNFQLLFPGPGKSMAKGSRCGRENGSGFQFAFSRAGKKQKAQTSNLLFPGPRAGKKLAQTSNLLSQAGKKQNGSDFHFQFAFSRARKKQNGPDFQSAFSRAEKKQNGSDFAFSRPGKKQIGSLSRKSKLDIQFAFGKAEKKSNFFRELWPNG